MQWLMLQQNQPEDLYNPGRIGVRRFIEITAIKLGWDKDSEGGIIWENKGLDEIESEPIQEKLL